MDPITSAMSHRRRTLKEAIFAGGNASAPPYYAIRLLLIAVLAQEPLPQVQFQDAPHVEARHIQSRRLGRLLCERKVTKGALTKARTTLFPSFPPELLPERLVIATRDTVKDVSSGRHRVRGHPLA